jgi:COP9 signalosome complex subunit 3
LKAKCYAHSLSIIDHPETGFKGSTSPMDILAYNYYRGMLFIGLKKYQKAIDSFKIVISMPSTIIHKVHIESYKKLILASLIHTFKFPSIPQSTSSMVRMKLENSLVMYKNLANSFVQKNDNEFFEAVALGFNEFEKDKNMGLILKLQKVYNKRRICDLN